MPSFSGNAVPCASSGVSVISSPTLYQIGTPMRMRPGISSARRRFENNSVNEPRFAPARVNCGTVGSRSREGRAAGNPPCPRRETPAAIGGKSPARLAVTAPSAPNCYKEWFRIPRRSMLMLSPTRRHTAEFTRESDTGEEPYQRVAVHILHPGVGDVGQQVQHDGSKSAVTRPRRSAIMPVRMPPPASSPPSGSTAVSRPHASVQLR